MSRPARGGLPQNNRERLKQDFTRAAVLRDMYPQLAEVRIELVFQDGTTRPPSSQSFCCFPAARGFFRYACPCHSCSGEFDLSGHVAELVRKASSRERTRRENVSCTGERTQEAGARTACPIRAQVLISAILHPAQ
ncbi:MAG: hypothetical protein QM696_01575 [Steroidobacteraceae bacterium]